MILIAIRQAKIYRWIFATFSVAIALSGTYDIFMDVNAFYVPMSPNGPPKTSVSSIERKICETVHHSSRFTFSASSFSILFSSPSSPDDDNKGSKDEDSRLDIGNSLEILAISVALFFVAAVAFVGGDKLFATPPPTTGTPRVVIDADAVLREDFEKSSSSVIF